MATQCDTLVQRSTFFTTFDESKGSADYRRWRKDLVSTIQTAGAGFVETLNFAGAMPAVAQMTDANIQSNEEAGLLALTMPQMRQQAILYVIRAIRSRRMEMPLNSLRTACTPARDTLGIPGPTIYPLPACV